MPCFHRDNARKYALEIRKLQAEFDAKIAGADLSKFRCATMHSGYDYILQELGLQVTAVIEPRAWRGAHGTAAGRNHRPHQGRQGERAVRREILRQQAFGHHQQATGVKMYSISHISSGKYTPGKFIEEMRENLNTLAHGHQRHQRRAADGRTRQCRDLPSTFAGVNLALGNTRILGGRELQRSAPAPSTASSAPMAAARPR